jgi:Lar family restriction alleviation protein
MSDQLKPCPFCGHAAPGLWWAEDANEERDACAVIGCPDCGAHGPTGVSEFDPDARDPGRSHVTAAEKWNRRPGPGEP